MRNSQSFWTSVLLSMEATTAAALSIAARTVAPSTAGPVLPYANNYTTLASGVRIYGTPARVASSSVIAGDDELVEREDVERSFGRISPGIFSSPSSISSKHDSKPRAAAGWCSASSIFNDGSDNSPLISDCQTIATQVYALAGDSNAYFGRSECNPDSTGQFTCYYPVVSFQTCMFGVSTIGAGLDISVRVGWQDVGDLITDSINQCGNKPSSGKVGASGEMACPEEISAILTFPTAWGLYHS